MCSPPSHSSCAAAMKIEKYIFLFVESALWQNEAHTKASEKRQRLSDPFNENKVDVQIWLNERRQLFIHIHTHTHPYKKLRQDSIQPGERKNKMEEKRCHFSNKSWKTFLKSINPLEYLYSRNFFVWCIFRVCSTHFQSHKCVVIVFVCGATCGGFSVCDMCDSDRRRDWRMRGSTCSVFGFASRFRTKKCHEPHDTWILHQRNGKFSSWVSLHIARSFSPLAHPNQYLLNLPKSLSLSLVLSSKSLRIENIIVRCCVGHIQTCRLPVSKKPTKTNYVWNRY